MHAVFTPSVTHSRPEGVQVVIVEIVMPEIDILFLQRVSHFRSLRFWCSRVHWRM